MREVVPGVPVLMSCRREGDDGERRDKGRDDSDAETVHESSFREEFGVCDGRQVF
jgi:hypothetical protein